MTALKWEKLGRVFDPRNWDGREWLHEFAQAPATLVRDDYVRVYFSCRPRPDQNGQYVSRSAWLDLDRSDLTKVLRVADEPVLSLGGLGCFDEFGTYPFSAIEEEQVDGVMGYFAGWTRCESVPFNTAIGCARSTDGGRTFERIGPGPVIGYSPDEPFVMSGPKVRKWGDQYHLFYIAGSCWKEVDGRPEPVYRIRRAVSPDGLIWTKHGKDLIPARLEADEAQASPDVFRYKGQYHMFFCYRYSEGFRTAARGYRIGYAVSDDLSIWSRDDGFAGLQPSDDGWDAGSVSYPHVFEVDGEIYMAYLGDGVGRYGFGLARLESGL